ncbi:MAG: helix-hairpin-helix domain-containing protein [Bacillota bacterium]
MININKVELKELTKVKGIGNVTASNIIQYRKENDGFKDLRELKNIKGIAELTYRKIKTKLTVGENTANNKVEITVNPQEIGIKNPDEIHLVGEMNDWNPADKTYSLNKKENGCWSNDFNLEAGTEYKIMYDSTDWKENKYFGDNGANLKIKK